jgi:predicted enzyme related to lactoylglutathione lyase
MDEVVHFEIPVDKLARAKKFYSSAFGWKLEDYPQFEYVGAITTPRGKDHNPKEPGAINGGMAKRNSVLKSPTVTIMVKDINASLKKVVKSGGKVAMKKEAIGDMGFIAYIIDTERNVIGLFQEAKK